MTFTQLEYIIALNTYKQFSLAAEKCYVTQPTLSMQVSKLEEELGVKIFDRNRQPIAPTKPGKEIILQAKKIIAQRDELLEQVSGNLGTLKGELRVGIIPTIAPYLLPLFIPEFTQKYNQIRLAINETTTEQLVKDLNDGVIDAAILVTPLKNKNFEEHLLYYEELMVYTSKKNALYNKEYILSKDIHADKLWLLEEGHCFRSQVMNFCELQRDSVHFKSFEYEAGSLETLVRLVNVTDGITFLPELATLHFNAEKMKQVKTFKSPRPVREVSLVTNSQFVKRQLINLIKFEILACVPEKIKNNQQEHLIPV